MKTNFFRKLPYTQSEQLEAIGLQRGFPRDIFMKIIAFPPIPIYMRRLFPTCSFPLAFDSLDALSDLPIRPVVWALDPHQCVEMLGADLCWALLKDQEVDPAFASAIIPQNRF